MIECNANINFGMPALRGRRLTVYDIVTKLYYEPTVNLALEDYEITMQDAKDAVAYCKSLSCKIDKNLIQFCDGCLQRTIAEGWHFKKEDYIEIQKGDGKIVVSKDNKIYFAGSLQEFEDSEFGRVTWLLAEEVDKRLE